MIIVVSAHSLTAYTYHRSRLHMLLRFPWISYLPLPNYLDSCPDAISMPTFYTCERKYAGCCISEARQKHDRFATWKFRNLIEIVYKSRKGIDEESKDGSNLRLFDVSAGSVPLYFEHFVVIDHSSARSGMNQSLGNHLSDNTKESMNRGNQPTVKSRYRFRYDTP